MESLGMDLAHRDLFCLTLQYLKILTSLLSAKKKKSHRWAGVGVFTLKIRLLASLVKTKHLVTLGQIPK